MTDVAILAAGTGNGRALWYLTRGTGAVTLILLTVSVVLGVVDARRWSSQRWPRFVVDAVHRNVSLLVLAVLALHVLTAWLDSFAPISLIDAVIPFHSSYRPVWLGLGALSLDLLVAIAVTSMLRARMGHQAWRAVHWLAYACWPVAVVHGLGTGTDTPAAWMLALTAACVLAVLAAAASRSAAGWPSHRRVRSTAFAALAIAPLALVLWLPGGPLGKGWARRSGTPAHLLGGTSSGTAAAVAAPARTATGSRPASGGGATLTFPFTAGFTGPLRQGTTPGGELTVDLDLTLDGPGARRLHVRIQGPPAQGGGVSMSSSEVDLGTASSPALYRGTVSALQGNQIVASVSGAGRTVDLQIALTIDQAAGSVTGSVTARPAGG
jgi:DMSO/TMAO reductase YedYZ heme-binding membrane subunit